MRCSCRYRARAAVHCSPPYKIPWGHGYWMWSGLRGDYGLRVQALGSRQSLNAFLCVTMTVERLTVLSCHKRSISISLAVLYIELMAEYGEFKNEGISQHFVREKQGHSANCKICKTEPSPAALKACTNIYADFIACPYWNAAAVLCTKLRSSLGDTTVNLLAFLRSYYQVHYAC